MDNNSSTGATKRLDGSGEDASRRYWKWRKLAKANLTLLEAKGTPKEAHGGARVPDIFLCPVHRRLTRASTERRKHLCPRHLAA